MKRIPKRLRRKIQELQVEVAWWKSKLAFKRGMFALWRKDLEYRVSKWIANLIDRLSRKYGVENYGDQSYVIEFGPISIGVSSIDYYIAAISVGQWTIWSFESKIDWSEYCE